MLVALNASSQRVVAGDAVRGEQYVCPACGEPVVLKQGTRVIHHFAHRPNSSCDSAGETMRHLQMKLRMLEGLRSLDPELEVVMCEGARRADVVVTIGRTRVAIECQQSAITIEELKQRNIDYQNRVLWVVDAPRFFGENGVRVGDIRPRRKTPLALRYLISMYGGLYVMDRDQLLFVTVSRHDWMDCDDYGFGCRQRSEYWADDLTEISAPWTIGFSGRVPVPLAYVEQEGWL